MNSFGTGSGLVTGSYEYWLHKGGKFNDQLFTKVHKGGKFNNQLFTKVSA
jgi:hypothetical protein